MSNEEMIAKALAEELRPWLERIKELEVKAIATGAELRLMKELLFRDEKHSPAPGDAGGAPWRGPGRDKNVTRLPIKGAA
jgi:hypothetical protein